MTTDATRPDEGMGLFPDQNPNPVLRMAADGTLTYANAAAAPILAAWRAATGERLAPLVVQALVAAAGTTRERVEVEHERTTFDVLPVWVPELAAYNLYGTDITAAKVVERFPGQNPNPVLRMTPDGVLWYANDASRPIIAELGIGVGDPLPDALVASLRAVLDDPTAAVPEIAGEGGRSYRLKPVSIPEFDFVNLYATDITAEKAVVRFPDQNPNPVLRLNRDGRLVYANPASALVRKALGSEVGDFLAPGALTDVEAALADGGAGTIELTEDGRVFTVKVVRVDEYDAINLYGTDITAVRQVEALSAANERLLLNILPPSIAERLRAGETVIADRFDDMAVLFADVVGFTELSSRLTPTDVVSLLNDVFSTCDRLADRFGLEKIKTVGDAYMVVGGLPHEVELDVPARPGGHAEDVADMGLAILAELASFGHAGGIGLQVRVGMHVGPAVAGVIGLKKFIYDVWGDTVNTASRMESTGLPGRLQVTRATRDRLAGQFDFERRGIVDVKGKGPIETWFLLRRRGASAMSGSAPNRVAAQATASGLG